MTKNKNIFINCKNANHFCDKNQYKEASLYEKIKLNIHLIYCKACRKYSAKNNKLSKLCNQPQVLSIDQVTKDHMRKELTKKITEEQSSNN